MTGARLQAALALTLALGLHLGAFALRPGPAGASGSGAGGDDLISLQAAAPSVAAMVAAWDAPPGTSTLAPRIEPPQSDTSPVLPRPSDPAPTRPAIAPMLQRAAQPDSPPLLDITTTPPPPAIKPKPRPQRIAEPAPAKPRTPPATPSDSTAAQSASGTGSAAVAGDSGQAQAPTLSQGKTDELTASWGASIRARIERRKRYPTAADGASGTVTVRLTVARSGALASLSIIGSSGNPALDEAAIKAVRNAGRFPAAPNGLTQQSYSFTLPMRFSR